VVASRSIGAVVAALCVIAVIAVVAVVKSVDAIEILGVARIPGEVGQQVIDGRGLGKHGRPDDEFVHERRTVRTDLNPRVRGDVTIAIAEPPTTTSLLRQA
jgi:hypothetical protein